MAKKTVCVDKADEKKQIWHVCKPFMGKGLFVTKNRASGTEVVSGPFTRSNAEVELEAVKKSLYAPCPDPKDPEDWWVNRFYLNGEVAGFVATKGVGRDNFSGPFTESKAKEEMDFLDGELDAMDNPPADGDRSTGLLDAGIPAWTAALLIGVAFGSAIGFIFSS